MTERFRLLLESLKLTSSEFADRIGVQRSSVSHVLSGRNKPSIDFLEKILTAFPETDATWLITGKTGVKYTLTENSKRTDYQSPVLNKLDPEADADRMSANLSDNERVDQIIIVYKNKSFRILHPE